MDIIFWIANYLHLIATLLLLIKIWCSRSCAGISGKTQLLYVLIFTTRYLDLYTTFISMQNTLNKILYLVISYSTVISIYIFFRQSYESKYDTFRIELLLLPCIAVAMIMNINFSYVEILWAFSIYLEAVAILPQFYFISKAKYISKHVLYYMLALGTYKALYIVHWIYRYYQSDYFDKFSAAGGIVQVILYCLLFGQVFPYMSVNKANEEPSTSIEANNFRFDLLIGACTVMGLLSSYKKWDLLTILWYFSIFLETFAIFPQIHFTTRAKYVGSSLIFYVGLLACYRAFYIVHWIYMFIVESHTDNYYVVVGGTVQFLIYCGYFVWMMPMFKAQYSHLKNVDTQPQEVIVTVQANGTYDNLK